MLLKKKDGLSIILLMAYILIYAIFLYKNEFLPYVIDNNETYSSLIHAYNMYFGDFKVNFGLTDEAYSPFKEAHPIIHTHQGNWPRIFAYFLFALGARTAESQILIHVFTIGIVSLYLMYKFFKEITNVQSAFIICLVFITDYMLFAQWQVVTYRVWHVFFVFLSLNCVLHANSKDYKWKIVFFLNFMALYYWELVFAFYVSLWSLLFYCFNLEGVGYKQRVMKTVICGIRISVAGLTALTVLFVQLFMFMGVKNTFTDFYLAFFARNLASDPVLLKEKLLDFYHDKDIAFFFNFADANYYKGFKAFLNSIFNHGFEYHTPIVSSMALILLLAWLCALLQPKFRNTRTISLVDSKRTITLLLFLLISATFFGQSFLGLKGTVFNASHLLLIAVALPISILAANSVYKNLPGRPELMLYRKHLSLCMFMIFCIGLVFCTPILYIQEYKEIWYNSLTAIYPEFLWRILLLSVVVLLARSILYGPEFIKSIFKSNQILKFFGAAILAYAVVFYLSPGYIYSGYLYRTAPFIVFFIDPLIALLFCYLFLGTFKSYSDAKYNNALDVCFKDRPEPKRNNKILTLLSMFVFSLILLQWFYMQYQYTKIFPADRLLFIKKLREPEFQNKSIVSNQYSLPFAYEARYWGYVDANIGVNPIELTPNGYSVKLNYDYLWYKDRFETAQYQFPDIFICFTPMTPEIAISRLKRQNNNSINSCLGNRTVTYASLAAANVDSNVQNHKVLYAEENYHRWAIIQMDWDFPPYLHHNPNSNKLFDIVYNKNTQMLTINYGYKHQMNAPEKETEFAIYSVNKDKKELLAHLNANNGRANVPIDLKHAKVLEVTAVPKSATKAGKTFTQIVSIEN